MLDPVNHQDENGLEAEPRMRRISIRLLIPNLLTLLAICAGMTGIRLAFEGRFEIAVIMVLGAAFLDGIDGRAARMLKATSNFGAQMDSLADIVNFGVAPALVLYAYLLDQAGSFGWIAAMLYAIACGLRLARFNVMLDDPNRPAWKTAYFVGVPAPAGAGLVMLPIYLGFLGVEPDRSFAMGAVVFTLIVAWLLVSRLPVYSGKTVGQRIGRDAVIPLTLGAVAYVLFLTSYTWETLVVSAVAYAVFLPLSVRAYRRRAAKEARA
ncbi:CDP-alcohol phosphatidyltransferase family protein [Tianweitania populi]|uniref:CDP-diacylglycerol--serine O-phosphatidyltransferase n=1 Tax=Tianweitania populi TaxID=1607949 RepID=A0A8J3GKF1_9HYPH|nr:phosphatidylcholine/phosphatidylserine synthase [Tianweitania populi]GHD06923.1 CDP-diacylglycerol--serine O-phosphatidyltransferase [Tianweitania populi]